MIFSPPAPSTPTPLLSATEWAPLLLHIRASLPSVYDFCHRITPQDHQPTGTLIHLSDSLSLASLS